ncbi:MAG: hypothetical protein ACD_78C00135G0010, partial [uncultured bacterium (gcode 4)]
MYNPKITELKWQKFWEEHDTFRTLSPAEAGNKPKKYILSMFPYPSGEGLHVGHAKVYSATDAYARYCKTKGYNVLHPMGWDAFGLPAENYAIKTGTHPAITTAKNVANYTRQMKSIGLSYDWSREVNTTDGDYIKQTQWIFLQLFERGLAYEQDLPINYCPSCKTGLANEEVVGDNKCDRCGTTVERRKIRQWVLKITEYAERLLADIDTLDWPESIKDMQRNWIGKSDGVEFDLQKVGDETKKISVYTTRIDTVYGMTYVVLAADHKDVNSWITSEQKEKSEAYIADSKAKSDLERTNEGKEKTGAFTGSYVVNPFNGEEIPVWIGDYVLGSYGTGAVMAVPAHDERDFEFAKKMGLKVKSVILVKWFTLVDMNETKGIINVLNRRVEQYPGWYIVDGTSNIVDGILWDSADFTGLTS